MLWSYHGSDQSHLWIKLTWYQQGRNGLVAHGVWPLLLLISQRVVKGVYLGRSIILLLLLNWHLWILLLISYLRRILRHHLLLLKLLLWFNHRLVKRGLILLRLLWRHYLLHLLLRHHLLHLRIILLLRVTLIKDLHWDIYRWILIPTHILHQSCLIVMIVLFLFNPSIVLRCTQSESPSLPMMVRILY